MDFLSIQFLKKRFLDIFSSSGVWAIGLSTLLESLGIPGTTLIFELGAGPLIVSGKASFLTVYVISVVGLLIGSILSYYLGYKGRDLLDRFLSEEKKKEREESRKAIKRFFDRYGAVAIFFAQLFGPTRTWGSYPAGYYKINFLTFVVFTFLGGSIYCVVIILISILYFTVAKTVGLRVLEHFGIPVWAAVVITLALFLLLAIVSAKLLWRGMKVGNE